MTETVETAIVKDSCGCLIMAIAQRTKGNKTNLSGFRIEHCKLHKAAPDLEKACKELFLRLVIHHALHQEICQLGEECPDKKALKLAEAALAKARPKE